MAHSDQHIRYSVPQNAVDPIALRVTLTSTDAVPDLTLVTGVVIRSADRDSTRQSEWSVDIVAQAEASLVVEHKYTASDTAVQRVFVQFLEVTIASAANPVRSRSWELAVVAR